MNPLIHPPSVQVKKCLSLWQPWASLFAIGVKTIETRSWHTSHRGPLAIHAAKRKMDPVARQIFERYADQIGAIAYGYILCVVTLYDCASTTDLWPPVYYPEQELGDYSLDRYAWLTRDCHRLETPVPCLGRQGLFNLPPSTSSALRLP